MLVWLVGYDAGSTCAGSTLYLGGGVATLCRRRCGTVEHNEAAEERNALLLQQLAAAGEIWQRAAGIKSRRHGADPRDVRKSAVIAVGLVTLVVYLLVTTHGKSCHYNVHFSKWLVCTDDAR